MNKKRHITIGILFAFISLSLNVNATLINGDFETGDLSGWTLLNADPTLQQTVVGTPNEFDPPLNGFSYRVRPGQQAPDAGISQTVNAIVGSSYFWSIDIAAREVQAPNFALGSFELLLDGISVASQTLTNGNSFSATFSGMYTALDSSVDFQLVFNRSAHGYTAHPQWFADNAIFASTSVPMPASLCLLMAGLLGMIRCRPNKNIA